MCCFVTTLLLLGPRAGILGWWLIAPARFALTFAGSYIWPILGLLFLPWTTLMYLILWSPGLGIVGLDWVLLALALLADLGTYGGGAYGNRDRLPGYGS
jgi:hypothetical protein